MNRRELLGFAASFGSAIGPLWMPERNAGGVYSPTGNSKAETAALKRAILLASDEITQLQLAATGNAFDILEYQRTVLADETYRDAALAYLVAGKNAFEAWNLVLDAEIKSYQLAAHEVFRARTTDLQDMCARVSRILCQQIQPRIPLGAIVLADNLSPTTFIAHDWKNGGIALTGGSSSSHVAVLARQFGVPMLINVADNAAQVPLGHRALLVADAANAMLIISPNADDKISIPRPIAKLPSMTPPTRVNIGGQTVSLMVNLAHLKELAEIDISSIDGVGLVRTEFLLAGMECSDTESHEQAQFEAYVKILRWAGDKPVYIRTLDAGADKQPAGLHLGGQSPSKRGIRLSLSDPAMFSIQIRALLRAAVFGNLHVTLPMVAMDADLEKALALFTKEAAKLSAAHIPYVMPPIGIMVEVPNVALTLEKFSSAAFFAIGTNDLIQYALAEPRDVEGPKSSIDHPAIIALIKNVVSVGASFNKMVSVCGDAASDAKAVAHLLSAGVRHLSVSPPNYHAVSRAIAKYYNQRGAC